MGESKIAAVILLTAMIASAPTSAYGFEVKGKYCEISRQRAGAFMFDSATVKTDTAKQLVLSKLESSWVSESSIRTTDIDIITAEVVTGDSRLDVIEYTAKAPGKAQPVAAMENGTAVNMGTFYITAAQDGNMAAAEWVQENG